MFSDAAEQEIEDASVVIGCTAASAKPVTKFERMPKHFLKPPTSRARCPLRGSSHFAARLAGSSYFASSYFASPNFVDHRICRSSHPSLIVDSSGQTTAHGRMRNKISKAGQRRDGASALSPCCARHPRREPHRPINFGSSIRIPDSATAASRPPANDGAGRAGRQRREQPQTPAQAGRF